MQSGSYLHGFGYRVCICIYICAIDMITFVKDDVGMACRGGSRKESTFFTRMVNFFNKDEVFFFFFFFFFVIILIFKGEDRSED
jgi:hypothetical protein